LSVQLRQACDDRLSSSAYGETAHTFLQSDDEFDSALAKLVSTSSRLARQAALGPP
jgi:hypothetical protein